jgi:hypothetical protein
MSADVAMVAAIDRLRTGPKALDCGAEQVSSEMDRDRLRQRAADLRLAPDELDART